jgi:hypothetical protein
MSVKILNATTSHHEKGSRNPPGLRRSSFSNRAIATILRVCICSMYGSFLAHTRAPCCWSRRTKLLPSSTVYTMCRFDSATAHVPVSDALTLIRTVGFLSSPSRPFLAISIVPFSARPDYICETNFTVPSGATDRSRSLQLVPYAHG